MKPLIAILAAVLLLFLGYSTWPRSVQAQQYHIEGSGIKKTWGPLRSSFVADSKLYFVFEDAGGTIRVAEMRIGGLNSAAIVSEMRRE